MSWSYYSYPPYESVASKKAKAKKLIAKLEKSKGKPSPIVIEGRKIATSFWGKSWCKHIESFSDYENRLPRGRSYVTNGFVLDLQIQTGKIEAKVMGSGSSVYQILISIAPLTPAAWETIKTECSGKIASVIELLEGRISDQVMAVVAHPKTGLFPDSKEIRLKCSCPDSAGLCKHLAAVLYGIGARLDRSPDLLFKLRGVNEVELIDKVVSGVSDGISADSSSSDIDISEVFGIELASTPTPPSSPTPKSLPSGSAPSQKPPAAAKAKSAAKPKSKSKPKSQAKTKPASSKSHPLTSPEPAQLKPNPEAKAKPKSKPKSKTPPPKAPKAAAKAVAKTVLNPAVKTGAKTKPQKQSELPAKPQKKTVKTPTKKT